MLTKALELYDQTVPDQIDTYITENFKSFTNHELISLFKTMKNSPSFIKIQSKVLHGTFIESLS